MIHPDLLRLLYIVVCSACCVALIVLAKYMFMRNNEYKFYVLDLIICGISSTIAYCFFLLSDTTMLALFFESLFFIGTDWLALNMYHMAIGYTEVTIKYKKRIFWICSAVCGLDTINLFVNNFTHHMFDIVLMTSRSGIEYWGNVFHWPHYVHLGICYVMVLLTFIYFIIAVKRCPKSSKKKYINVLLIYMLVIAANAFCYTLNTFIDISVVLYGLLAGFFCYYSTYSLPHSVLNNSLDAVNETISDAVMYFDVNGNCIYANRKAKSVFANDGEFIPCLAEAYSEELRNNIIENRKNYRKEDCFKIEGKECHYEVEYQKEFFDDQEVGACLKLIDRTQAYVSYRRERYIATHDSFTGALNRLGFLDAVDEMLQNQGYEGRVMVCSNIKDFKLINELFGEELGDKVIAKQADILKKFSHPDTIFARICDDKYALFAKREYFVEDEFSQYIALMQKITDSPQYTMHMTVGIYEPDQMESAQAMYDKALLACAQIHDVFGVTYSYYDSSLMDKLLYEKEITDTFETAIKEGQIEMFLQPIMNEKTSEKGVEVLSRWNHPQRGFLLPGQFLSILEKHGLIFQLDEYIWEEAVKLLRRWNDQGIDNTYISVNVSEKDFFYTDIYRTFTNLADTYNINPANLHIEITEEILMFDFKKALELTNKLKNHGFNIVLDNFGNGYSSLNMLKDFNASTIKIDMSLLRNSDKEERKQVVLRTIVELAKALQMDVVGEGVEEEVQLAVLKKCNCLAYQGNYIAKPMSVADYEKKNSIV